MKDRNSIRAEARVRARADQDNLDAWGEKVTVKQHGLPLCEWRFCANPTFPPVSRYRADLPFCDTHYQQVIDAVRAVDDEIERSRREYEAQPAAEREGCVYYIQVGDLVKIGFTTSLWQRSAQYPPNAQLLAVEPGTRALERERHGKFSVYLAKGREWFRVCDEITEWVDSLREKHGDRSGEMHQFSEPGERKDVVVPKGYRGHKRTAA